MGLYHWHDRSPSEQPAPVDAANCRNRCLAVDDCNSMPTGAAATALFLPNAMTFFLHHPRSPRITRRLAKTITRAIADPLNPQSWKGGRGHAVSALEMPQAPLQPGWDCPQAPETPAKEIIWKSERLKIHAVYGFYHRRCNSRRTPAGSFA